jgi:hypothetical protein
MAGAQSGGAAPGVARQPLNLRHSSRYSHVSQETTPTPPVGQRPVRDRNCPEASPGRRSARSYLEAPASRPTHGSSRLPLPDGRGHAPRGASDARAATWPQPVSAPPLTLRVRSLSQHECGAGRLSRHVSGCRSSGPPGTPSNRALNARRSTETLRSARACRSQRSDG